MKVKKFLNSSGPALLLFILLIMLAVSCRRDFDDPSPEEIPPFEFEDDGDPAVFPDDPADIIWQDFPEAAFPANEIKELGEGLNLEKFFEGLEIGGLIFEIYDYFHTEARFDEIDDKLNDIEKQIDELEDKMDQLEKEIDNINQNINDLATTDETIAIDGITSDIEIAYGDLNIDGFMFYSTMAKAYQENPTNQSNIDQMAYLKSYIPTYVHKIYPGDPGSSMANLNHKIYTYLCAGVLTDHNALHAYAKTLVVKSEGQLIDSTRAMNTYLYLESYFLKIVNYQFQAATIYMNAAHFLDSTRTLGFEKQYWKSFSKDITEEIEYFQQMVDYLTVNMAEYRDKQRFVNDMQYANVGLAPDHIFNSVYARSQFVANMLYSALGIKPPVVSGHILIPARYTTDGSASSPSFNLSIGASNIVATASNPIYSMIPYTYWQNQTCHPDNKWVVYRFSTDTNIVWPDVTQDIKVLSPPWPSNGIAKGSVTALYYNPRNPSQTSKVKTDSCTFQFGYFSANWQWGYLYLSQNADNDAWGRNSTYLYTKHYNRQIYDYPGVYFWPTVPLGGNTSKQHSSDGGFHFTDSKAIDFYHNSNFSADGTMQAVGTRTNADKKATKHDYYFIIADYLIRNVKTSADIPTNKNNKTKTSLQAWGAVDGYCNTSSTHPSKLIASMGTECDHFDNGDTRAKNLKGDVFENTFTSSSSNPSYNYFGTSDINESNTYDQAGFGYYFEEKYDKKKTSALPLKIVMNFYYQFIYTGTYPAN
ncbi:MAG: hypothetical protein P1P88_07920 [Bacteroidales bacterium]|nr:hypothetical protein [Bacteroidales bacterium]